MALNSAQQEILDSIWNSACENILGGVFEVVIPAEDRSQLGAAALNILQQRFQNVLGVRPSVFNDPQSGNATRLIPPIGWGRSTTRNNLSVRSNGTAVVPAEMQTQNTPEAYNSSTNLTLAPDNAALNRSKIAKSRQAKIPRPPNAFILYRQHHHSRVKTDSPNLHNNEISVIIGKKWKNETEDIKNYWRNEAEQKRKLHYQEHPDYQYAPRKSVDKKRRQSSSSQSQTLDLDYFNFDIPGLFQSETDEIAWVASLASQDMEPVPNPPNPEIYYPQGLLDGVIVNYHPGSAKECTQELSTWDASCGWSLGPLGKIQLYGDNMEVTKDKTSCFEGIDFNKMMDQLASEKEQADNTRAEAHANGDFFTSYRDTRSADLATAKQRDANQLRRFDREEYRTKGCSVFDKNATVNLGGGSAIKLAEVLRDNLPEAARRIPVKAVEETEQSNLQSAASSTTVESLELSTDNSALMTSNFLHLDNELYTEST